MSKSGPGTRSRRAQPAPRTAVPDDYKLLAHPAAIARDENVEVIDLGRGQLQARIETHAFFDAVLAHPDYRCGFDFFGDSRGVDRAPDPSYIYAVAAEVTVRAKVLAPCRWAVVVADETGLLRANTWAVIAAGSGVQIELFRSVDDAARWLGLPCGYTALERVFATVAE